MNHDILIEVLQSRAPESSLAQITNILRDAYIVSKSEIKIILAILTGAKSQKEQINQLKAYMETNPYIYSVFEIEEWLEKDTYIPSGFLAEVLEPWEQWRYEENKEKILNDRKKNA